MEHEEEALEESAVEYGELVGAPHSVVVVFGEFPGAEESGEDTNDTEGDIARAKVGVSVGPSTYIRYTFVP